jgi:hypothetical protein
MTKSVCIARDLFHAVRDEHLEPFFRNWGFKHSPRGVFVSRIGDALWRVAVDFVRDVPRDQGRIDVSLGVVYTSLANFLKNCPILADTIKMHGNNPLAVAADLAFLHPRENREVWIFASSSPAEVANTILDEMRTAGFDWFEKNGSLDQTIAAWEAKSSRRLWDTIFLSAAYWLRGDHDRAIKIVEKERDQYGPFEQKRALFHEVDTAAQVYEWLIQQPKSGSQIGADFGKMKPRRPKP